MYTYVSVKWGDVLMSRKGHKAMHSQWKPTLVADMFASDTNLLKRRSRYVKSIETNQ